MKTFGLWLEKKLVEDISEEAWEFIGQGLVMNHPIIKPIVQSLGLSHDEESANKVARVLINLPKTTLAANQIPHLDNLANKAGDKVALQSLIKYRNNPTGSAEQAYAQAMQARDAAEGRQRGYDVSLNIKRVQSGQYEPPLLFQAGNKLIVVGGRTRLYAAYALGQPIKVIVVTEDALRRGLQKAA